MGGALIAVRRAARASVVPLAVFVGLSLVATGVRMLLLPAPDQDDASGAALNYLCAILFQLVTIGFLIVIALRLRHQRRWEITSRLDPVLDVSLLILLTLVATYSIVLLPPDPPFGTLMLLGLSIIVVTWAALLTAVAIAPPRVPPAVASR